MLTNLVLLMCCVGTAEQQHYYDTTPYMLSDREIVLADGCLFPRMTPLEAELNANNLQTAIKLYSWYVCSENGYFAYINWLERCTNRIAVWMHYAKYLDTARHWRSRLDALYVIREYIGYEAFYAGQLPDITPDL